jgi:hypothetical protein
MKPIVHVCLASLTSRSPVAISGRSHGSYHFMVAVHLDSWASRSLITVATKFNGDSGVKASRYQGPNQLRRPGTMAGLPAISTGELGTNASSTMLVPSLNCYRIDLGPIVPCGQGSSCCQVSILARNHDHQGSFAHSATWSRLT